MLLSTRLAQGKCPLHSTGRLHKLQAVVAVLALGRCLFVCLSVRLFASVSHAGLPQSCLSVRLSVCLSVSCLSHLSMSVCLSICLDICLSCTAILTCRLHNLAHVELNAVDLAWDTVARFSHLKLDQARQLLSVRHGVCHRPRC